MKIVTGLPGGYRLKKTRIQEYNRVKMGRWFIIFVTYGGYPLTINDSITTRK